MLRQKLLEIADQRATSGPLPTGSAPFTSSAQFKISRPRIKPRSKTCDHLFEGRSQNQAASSLKAASASITSTDIISLGTARPSPEFYPWESITMEVKSCLSVIPNSNYDSIPSVMSCTVDETAYDLSTAMNYGFAAGSPQLLRFITEHVELVHAPPYEDWATVLTSSSTSAIDLALRLFCVDGDWILAEEYTYSGTLEAAKSQGLRVQGIKMDSNGLLVDDLEARLRNWDTSKGPKPVVLYLIPSGHNPTSVSLSTHRRKEILRVAEEHNLYIIEDDPYYFLQLGGADQQHSDTNDPEEADDYFNSLPPSLLSLDTSGRGLRLDTTSKILAPGLRCGWITGSTQIIEKVMRLIEMTTVAPSGPSQVLLYKLLDQRWGHQGFFGYLSHLSSQYRRRRDVLDEACARYLPTQICHWQVPTTGMFLWIHLDLDNHPLVRGELSREETRGAVVRIEDRIYVGSKDNGVLVSKGSWFATDRTTVDEVCIRLTFAAAPEGVLEEAVSRFGKVVRAEFGLK